MVSLGQPATAAGRVVFGAISVRDADEVAQLLAESADFHRGWVSYPTERDQVTSFVTDVPGDLMIFGVRLVADHALAGIMTLCRFAGEPWATAEYGCAVGIRHRGHGYLTEATSLLLRSAFTDLRLHRVEALVRPDNHASARMLTAAGFHPEGTARGAVRVNGSWQDHVRWAVTAEDYGLTGFPEMGRPASREGGGSDG